MLGEYFIILASVGGATGFVAAATVQLTTIRDQFGYNYLVAGTVPVAFEAVAVAVAADFVSAEVAAVIVVAVAAAVNLVVEIAVVDVDLNFVKSKTI